MVNRLKGRKQSPEHIAKRVAAWHASSAPAKAIERLVALNKSRVGQLRSQEQIEKHRAKMMGRSREWLLGRKQSISHRLALSAYHRANPEKHPRYVDGRGAERHGERAMAMSRIEYKLWREAVFSRDNWTCVHCGDRGVKLNADHIQPWSSHPELRYDVENGRTLCVPCHRATPTFAGRGMKRKASVSDAHVQ